GGRRGDRGGMGGSIRRSAWPGNWIATRSTRAPASAAHARNTFAAPPAYGKQNRRITTDSGVRTVACRLSHGDTASVLITRRVPRPWPSVRGRCVVAYLSKLP